ncbi:HET-domain-containing protein [Xylariaceae sp. AK1471]|nr:HET-domain-containing protein [Xylariaceae sp. AK1471]
MFRWYQDSYKCYVILSDVSTLEPAEPRSSFQSTPWMPAFRNSKWFTRGWTLQELLAPSSVEFYSREGNRLGDKISLMGPIHDITGIPVAALQGTPLSSFTIDERMSWSKNRQSSREEDLAYSLLGIFGVYMPLIYGEGRNYSFRRLRQEIQSEKAITTRETPVTEDSGTRTKSKTTSSLQDKHQEISTPGRLYLFPLVGNRFRLFVLETGTMETPIKGQLLDFSFADAPTYYAMSYNWGQESDIHNIIINDINMRVRPNLFQALLRVRSERGKIYLWIDYICIKKDDIERNAQVMNMAQIYRNANGIFIWLGEEDSTSNTALDFISDIIQSDFQWSEYWWKDYKFSALAQILERPWFRRGWVLQEAASSRISKIYCGNRQLHMDDFTAAIDLVRKRFSYLFTTFGRTTSTIRIDIMENFYDSPAVRLLDIIGGAFTKSPNGGILKAKMTLEMLVDAATFSETSDPRDTIYALLSLANDTDLDFQEDWDDINFTSKENTSINSAALHDSKIASSRTDNAESLSDQDDWQDISMTSVPRSANRIIPDYRKNVLDVYVDFIQHCCHQSASLDIIIRPWAPILSSSANFTSWNMFFNNKLSQYPSWIATRDRLPFGDPSWRLNHRLHGNSLVGGSHKRIYNACYGLKPCISIGRNENGGCNGSLYAKGIILGEIGHVSTRLADAMITKECLDILGTVSDSSQSDRINLPDCMWRTLCADRDTKGEPAPRVYRLALNHLIQISSKSQKQENPVDLVQNMSSIDIEELLDTKIPDHVKEFLCVIRDVVWNRRTFQSKKKEDEEPVVGLAPQKAQVGDQVCILYGCSVPVVVRKLLRGGWVLIGEAYVHGKMDGEAISFASLETLKSMETVFRIQ